MLLGNLVKAAILRYLRSSPDVTVGPICEALDRAQPERLREYSLRSFKELITFVQDRPGHDRRYAIDATKLRTQLGWAPEETFDTGIVKTVQWYLDNGWWWQPIREKKYAGERLGSACP